MHEKNVIQKDKTPTRRPANPPGVFDGVTLNAYLLNRARHGSDRTVSKSTSRVTKGESVRAAGRVKKTRSGNTLLSYQSATARR